MRASLFAAATAIGAAMRSCVSLALVLTLLVPAAGASAQARPRPFQVPAPGDLFVLTAAAGTLERVPGRSRVFELVLRRPARDVTMFTDRPARRAGEQPLRRFVRRWAELGFREVPPNAALVLAHAPSNRDIVVVELSRPRLRAGGSALAFRAEVLRGSPRGLLREFARRADHRVGDRFGRVSLYIDPGFQQVGLSFTFSNIPSNDVVSILCQNALVDPSGPTGINVMAGGPATLTVGSSIFTLGPSGVTAMNGTVEIGLNVVADATSVTGVAQIPAATTATVTVESTNKRFPVTDGRLSIPLS